MPFLLRHTYSTLQSVVKDEDSVDHNTSISTNNTNLTGATVAGSQRGSLEQKQRAEEEHSVLLADVQEKEMEIEQLVQVCARYRDISES